MINWVNILKCNNLHEKLIINCSKHNYNQKLNFKSNMNKIVIFNPSQTNLITCKNVLENIENDEGSGSSLENENIFCSSPNYRETTSMKFLATRALVISRSQFKMSDQN